MAARRMFASTFVLSDAFQDMSGGAKALYLALGVSADDEGFIASPRGTMRLAGATDDDLKQLVDFGFVILFPSGVAVLTHWNVNNKIRSDRFTPTACTAERAELNLDMGGVYRLTTKCQPNANQTPTQYR